GGNHKSIGRDGHLKLTELGISRHQSARWRQIASVSEEVFLKYVTEANDQGEEINDRGLLKSARQHAAQLGNGRQRRHAPHTDSDGEVFSLDRQGNVWSLQADST